MTCVVVIWISFVDRLKKNGEWFILIERLQCVFSAKREYWWDVFFIRVIIAVLVLIFRNFGTIKPGHRLLPVRVWI